MTETPSPRLRRKWWKYALGVVAFGFVVLTGLSIYVNTEAFQSLVRRKLIAEVERITGGRAQIASIHTIPFRLQVEVRDITVHGRESATDVPLAHADAIVGRFKISSLLRPELAFHQIILDRPIIHVEFYPDGTSNFPSHKLEPGSAPNAIEKLISLSVNTFELRHGQILWDDQTIPVDFVARDTSMQMEYSFLSRRYDGRLLLGLVDSKLLNCRPFAWMAALEFTLSSNSAVISSLKWNSGHSHITATGQVTDFRNPHVQGPYHVQLDLTELASIARRPDLRGGQLDLKGRVNWSLDQFSSTGLLALQDLSFQNEEIAFSKASLTTGYAVSNRTLEFSKLQGKILGGSFTGDAEVNAWLAPAQRLTAAARKSLETATISAAPSIKSGQLPNKSQISPKASGIQTGFMILRLRDLSSQEIASALNTAAHPFRPIRTSALASATIETRWKGTPRDADLQFTLDLTPPASVESGAIPLNSSASGVYHVADDTLDLPRFSLTTPTSRVQANGRLSRDSALRFSVFTSSVSDWLPLIAAIRGPELVPVALNGTASFNGNMTGSLTAPQISGTLVADNFDLTIPATNKTRSLQTHWNNLSSSVQLSFDSVALRNAKLKRDDMTAVIDASASLQHGHLTALSGFNVHADLHNADLAPLQAIVGIDYPIDGKADVSLRGGGTIGNPHAEGQIHAVNASVYGKTIRQFDSGFQLGDGQIAFNGLHLSYNESIVTGDAAFRAAAQSFQFDLDGRNIDLADFPRLSLSHFSVQGRADFELKGSGTPKAPSLTGNVHLRGLTLNHQLAGDLDLQAVTHGKQLQLTGSSHFNQGSLTLAGNVQLQNDYPAQLSLKVDHIELDPVLRAYIGNEISQHSVAVGAIDIGGPLFNPGQWSIRGDLSGLEVNVENVKLHNQDPVRFSIANETLDLQQLRLIGDRTDLSAHGTIQLSGAHALDLAAEGHADLRLISTFDPNFTANGPVHVTLTVAGTIEDPFPQGRIEINNSTLAYAGLPSGLTDLQGVLLFTRDQLHINNLAAHTGGGAVDLNGDASFVNRQLTFNLTATAKDVRMRYPPGVSSTADAQLHWAGSRSASTVSGDILVNKVAITPGFDFGAYIDRSRQLGTISAASSPLNNIKLDVHVQTAPELQMRTAIARFSGDADLHIRGSLGHPAVLGRADILEGQATFHGTRFTLERGDITFANPVAIEPQLNLQASTHVRDYDLEITITGTPDRGLSINYRSEPPLPKSEIIALLALGRTSEESAQLQDQSAQSAFSDEATAQILSQALNNTVGNRLQRLFGASNIKIDPQGLTTETNPISNGPQITIEQEFANHISLIYSTNVSQSTEQIIQGEYYVNRNISAVGMRDQNGVVSFDLRLRSRKK